MRILGGLLLFVFFVASSVSSYAAETPTTSAFVADQASTVAYPERHAPVYQKIATLHTLDGFVNLGDWDHRFPDHDTPSIEAFERMWTDVTTCQTVAGCDWATWIGPSVPNILVTWDDHNSWGDNTDRFHPEVNNARTVFKQVWPDTYPNPGIERDRVIGRVHVILPDTRSYRDRNSKANGPTKTMLGPVQKSWLISRVAASTSPWIVIVSSIPWHDGKCGTKPDSWCGFTNEQQSIVTALSPYCQNKRCIVVSGDVHYGGAIDNGTCTPGSYPEVSTPHINMKSGVNLGKMPCWSEGVDSGKIGGGYTLLTATDTTLLIETRGLNGKVRRSLSLP